METNVQGGEIHDQWRIPAQAERLARRQAKANATIKGRNNVEIVSVEKIEDGSLPGQSIYRVDTASSR